MTKTNEEHGGYVLGTLLLLPSLWTWPPFVMMKLWAWHVAPLWHVPAIGYGHMVGIGAMIGVLKLRIRNSNTTARKTFYYVIGHNLSAAIALLLGWWAL